MTDDVAVFDATPLIAFHQVGQLELVRRLFSHTLAPAIVANEVRPSFGALPPWIDVREIREMPTFWRKIDSGERAAISLAMQLSADFVILDDLAGRLMAAELGLTVSGSLGLLVRAKRHGLLREVRPVMDEMIANGLYTSDRLRREILALADETDL
jgi:predicted nucleic acid-binding protein